MSEEYEAGKELNQTLERYMKGMFWSARYVNQDTGATIGEPFDLVPDYSKDMAAAWQVLMWWKGDWKLTQRNDMFKCELFRPSEQWDAWADTAPLAICRALAAVAAEKEKG